MLLIALALVSGYVFFVQKDETGDPVEEPPWLYNVDINDMKQITVTHEGEEAFFTIGTDNRWHIGDPDGLPVGGQRWGGIELLLSGTKTRRLLDPRPTELVSFGLDSPGTRIEVELKDGRIIPLLLGFQTPDGGNQYAQIEGFPQLFTVYFGWGDILTRLISEPPYPAWYYNIDVSTITDIDLDVEGQRIQLTMLEGGWQFNDASETPVDEAQLASVMAALDERPVQQLVESAVGDLSFYGLNQPTFTARLTKTRTEDNLTYATETLIEVGRTTEDGKAYYARTVQTTDIADGAEPDVYRIDTQWVEDLKASVANSPSIGASDPGSSS